MMENKPATDSAAAAAAAKPKYDPNFTDNVIAATGPNANPRLKQIMPSLLRHLHDFAREVDLTVAEWMVGVETINEAGRMSTDRRNETQLLCDVLGLESLVDEITSKLILRDTGTRAAAPAAAPTPSAILGPFYRADAPVLPNGSSIISPAAEHTPWYAAAGALLARHIGARAVIIIIIITPLIPHLPSTSTSISTSAPSPVPGATLDVWLAGPSGLYEQQDASQPDMNLRGRFRTDAGGRYALRCVRPTAYPIPADGPAGRLLAALDRHPLEAAHVHFIVSAPGHRTLVTQVFDAADGRAGGTGGGDAVFAVKRELVAGFREKGEGEDEDGVRWELEFDFWLGRE